MLTQETISRIGKEAAEKSNQHSKLTHSQRYAFENGYFEGATAEATRALTREKVLVDALKEIRNECPNGSWFAKTCDKALTTYTQEKEAENG